MSVNRERPRICMCCGERSAQVFSVFCERCWNDNPDGCKEVLGMSEYNARYPRPRPVGRKEWWKNA